jgi:hypothetical protein
VERLDGANRNTADEAETEAEMEDQLLGTPPSAPGMSGYLSKMGGIRQNW